MRQCTAPTAISSLHQVLFAGQNHILSPVPSEVSIGKSLRNCWGPRKVSGTLILNSFRLLARIRGSGLTDRIQISTAALGILTADDLIRGVVGHGGLRSERIRIRKGGGDTSGTLGDSIEVYNISTLKCPISCLCLLLCHRFNLVIQANVAVVQR